MVRECAFPNCWNKMRKHMNLSFHRIPFGQLQCRRQWLLALNLDVNTPLGVLRSKDYRVCSEHFNEDDYFTSVPGQKHMHLKPNVVPRPKTSADATQDFSITASTPHVTASADRTQSTLRENWQVMDTPQNQFRGTGTQVPEMCAATTEKPPPQYIVDEKAILQLMKNCPACDRLCFCRKYTRGPYLIIYQTCHFCDYQRKWASQPEATIIKTCLLPKKKLKPKDKVCV